MLDEWTHNQNLKSNRLLLHSVRVYVVVSVVQKFYNLKTFYRLAWSDKTGGGGGCFGTLALNTGLLCFLFAIHYQQVHPKLLAAPNTLPA